MKTIFTSIVAILIAPSAFAGICDRSEPVRLAIEAKLTKACDQITDADLATISSLNLSRQKIISLLPHDFQNLNSLNLLDLSDNRLEELPVDIFRGLRSLKSLQLGSNLLGHLPSGLFEDLSSLLELHIGGSTISPNLTSIAPGAFKGLSSLQRLKLFYNKLTELPPDLFNDSPNLLLLELDTNALTDLPAGIFSAARPLGYRSRRGRDGRCAPDETLP